MLETNNNNVVAVTDMDIGFSFLQLGTATPT